MAVSLSWMLFSQVNPAQRHPGFFHLFPNVFYYLTRPYLCFWNILTLSIVILFDIWKKYRGKFTRREIGRGDFPGAFWPGEFTTMMFPTTKDSSNLLKYHCFNANFWQSLWKSTSMRVHSYYDCRFPAWAPSRVFLHICWSVYAILNIPV